MPRRTCAIALLLASAAAQSPPVLRTTAEASDWTRTATHEELLTFVSTVAAQSGGVVRVEEYGRSGDGQPLVALRAGARGDPAALRILVQANIHGGEVEGKDVLQILARELADGSAGWLPARVELVLLPNLNPDGNDRIDRRNRVAQNGPDGGVGQRENRAGLDLNRDFVKLESPEIRALLGVYRAFDPHVVIDLHTTNGSYHGYHLTFAPSLAVNVDPELDGYARRGLLPAIQQELQAQQVRSEHYGNFGRGREPKQWVTFDHRPRFGTNYAGLRNRLGLLCEAYSYLEFRRRAEVTRAFVLGAIAAAARDREAILARCAAADARCAGEEPLEFGYASRLADPVEREILVGAVRRVELPDGIGTRFVAEDRAEPKQLAVQDTFVATQRIALPAAWVVRDAPEELIDLLLAHGLQLARLKEPVTMDVEQFVPSGMSRSRAEFQGHRPVTVQGEHRAVQAELPAGTLVVPRGQALARVAAQLLEPLSEDGCVTWNRFDAELTAAREGGAEFPILRVRDAAALPLLPARR